MQFNKQDYFEKVEECPSTIYYHYTSLEVLYEIIKNRSFWLTSLKSSNDKKEIPVSYTNYHEIISEILLDNQNDSEFVDFIQRIQLSAKKHDKELKKRFSGLYALSLVDKKDNLTHWDRYARMSTGVCIAVNVASIDVLSQRRGIPPEVNQMSAVDFAKVIYDKDTIKQNITKELLFRYKQSIRDSEFGEFLKETISEAYTYYLPYEGVRKFTKEESFIDESECRIVFDPHSMEETKKILKSMALGKKHTEQGYDIYNNYCEYLKALEIEEMRFAAFQNGIRSYHCLNLSEVWGSGVIPEIIIGPMCKQNKFELKMFLNENGLRGTKVSISNVPIR